MLALAVLALVTAVQAPAQAQRITSSIDLQSTRLRYADTVNATATGITPSVSVSWHRATLAAYGTYAQLARAWSADGSATGSVFTPSRRGWSGEIAGTAGGSTHADGTRTAAATGTGRLHIDGARGGAWLGAGIGTTSDGFVWRGVRQGEAGVWLGGGPGTLTLAALPTMVDESIRYTDMSAAGRWHGQRLELDALLGSRLGARLPSIASDVKTWGSATAAVWVVPRIAVIASAGTYPVDYTRGFPGGRFASIGIRLALTRRATGTPEASAARVSAANGVEAFRVESGARRGAVLRAYAPHARRVEIMGDLTGWKPRRLTPAGGGWYTVAFPAKPGSYELVLRADGREWGPPPGVPTVRDEFGGMTGVLVIE